MHMTTHLSAASVSPRDETWRRHQCVPNTLCYCSIRAGDPERGSAPNPASSQPWPLTMPNSEGDKYTLRASSRGPGWGMSQQTAPSRQLRAGDQDGSCHGEEVVGGKKRNISLLDPEQPRVGVNLAAPKGQLPSSDSARLCSSSSSSIQPPHTSHGEQTAHPKPLRCYRGGKHLATSLLREKATKKKSSIEKKAQNKAIWDAGTPKFSKVFLASSFALKETAVQTLAAAETGGGSQHIFIALFLKPPQVMQLASPPIHVKREQSITSSPKKSLSPPQHQKADKNRSVFLQCQMHSPAHSPQNPSRSPGTPFMESSQSARST